MKKQYLFLVASLLLCSCSSWLDVSPSNEIDEKHLYASGSGYRSALNGIYQELSSQSLYGQELTWGFLDVLAQNYDRSNLGSTKGAYYNAARYLYDNKAVEPMIQSIWLKAFFAIANDNALLTKIEQADNKIFTGGADERNFIWGEALALRALMHFDILRLYAPALNADDGKAYTPYVDTFPSTVNSYLTVREVLARIETDLLAAREKLKKIDCGIGRYLLQTAYRFVGIRDEEVLNGDQFYALRGFRMNYMAATALLARVYSYGGKSQEAYEMASEVIDFVDDNDSPMFTFTESDTFETNPKMHDDLIFGLSNTHLIDFYKQWAGTVESTQHLCVDYDTYQEVLNEDAADSRWTEQGGLWGIDLDNYISYPKKYREITTYSERTRRLIPMIRLSEMHYIRAEHLAKTSPEAGALEVDIVSTGRGCMARNFADITAGEFQEVLFRDAFKEFFGEGQLYFLYKKLGVKPYKDANFVFPLPDNEQIH